MTGFAIVIILVALGVIIGNIMLLKHSAKVKMGIKNFNQDPIEKARKTLAEREHEENRDD
jgi:hypothetical protein